MRTKLELWKVVNYNFNEYFIDGLCLLITKLFIKGIISKDEYISIHVEIKRYGNTKDFFLGAKGNPKPRLEFIDKMIKKYSQ